VREGAGERAAQLIDHMKKGDMAKEAERLLANTGWLPEPLRLTGADGDEALPAFLTDDDDEEEPADVEEDEDAMIAAK
jgi:ParB family chromosome partitioning protein